MAAKNHQQWTAKPWLADGECIDSRIYSDQAIFDEELEKIFKHIWIPVCHESELWRNTSNAASDPDEVH